MQRRRGGRSEAEEEGKERRIQEATEPAPEVWPPPTRDSAPAGEQAARRFLDGRVSFELPGDLDRITAHPGSYREQEVLPRLVDVVSRLPRDLFQILDSGRREVRFHVQPATPFSPSPIAETRPYGPAADREYVVFLRGVLELDDRSAFTGIVVHELCHVILDHPAPITWPHDPYEQRKFLGQMETEALKLGEELGFKEETWVLRDLLLDLAEAQQEREQILPDGRARKLALKKKGASPELDQFEER